MIETFVLFLGLYGAFAAPIDPGARGEQNNVDDNDAEIIAAQLPGIENLNEKALPLSRLYTSESDHLPGNRNLAERWQIPRVLPGTNNLAEKSIPDYVLQRMSDPSNTRISSDPDIPQIPID